MLSPATGGWASTTRPGTALRHLPPWVPLLIVGHTLLVLTWLVITPPHAAPDETAHLQRVQGLARGQVLGSRPATSPVPTDGPVDPQAAWAAQTTRVVRIPGSVAPWPSCVVDARVPADCVDAQVPGDPAIRPVATNTATTFPVSVLGPALLVRLGGDPGSAATWARLGQAGGTVLALLAIVLALRPAGPAAALGVALAVTPFAAYLGGMVSPSGMETWVAMVGLAAAWRMLQPGSGTRWLVLACTCAAVLPAVRQPGLAWALLGVGAAVLLTRGPDRLAEVSATRRRRLRWWAGACAMGVGAATWWGAVTDVATPRRWPPRMADVARAGRDVDELADHVVAGVNLLEVPPPDAVVQPWLWMVVVLVVAALVMGARRRSARRDRGAGGGLRAGSGLVQGAVPLLVLLGVVGFALAFWTLSYVETGFGLQGRHILGGLVLVPLAAALAVRPPARVAGAVVALTGVGHAVVLAVAARRFAVGIDGPWAWWTTPAWDPAGGWLRWVALGLAGSLAVVLAGLLVTRSGGSAVPVPAHVVTAGAPARGGGVSPPAAYDRREATPPPPPPAAPAGRVVSAPRPATPGDTPRPRPAPPPSTRTPPPPTATPPPPAAAWPPPTGREDSSAGRAGPA